MYQTTGHRIPEDSNLVTACRVHFKYGMHVDSVDTEETILIFYYRYDEQEEHVLFEVAGSGRPSSSSELMDGKFALVA
jgi:hypothetical protein